MKRIGLIIGTAFAIAITSLYAASAPRQVENLGRGVVAINQGQGKVFVSWRLLGTESDSIAFNVYRTSGTSQPIKLNQMPITKSTCYQDGGVDLTQDNVYVIRAVLNGQEQAASKPFLNKVAANSSARPYFSIPLKTPQGYSPNDASVGDLDGDGEYEIVLHQTGRGRDNSQGGMTDPPILQAHKLDGTFLWQINLGKNIREGAHYTQFMVYDLDGDGRAEIVCKTADGTVDGTGKVIGDPKADYVSKEGFTMGKILNGPEFLTVFDGRTGAALTTVNYVPPRGDVGRWGNLKPGGRTDNNGNRADRFLACVAYLDGVQPSVVMCRGYYGRTVLAAWDWRGGKFTRRWVFDSDDGTPGNDKYRGQGNHQVSVADVNGDGRDEIVYGSCVIGHDGKGLYSTGREHGDALHCSDLDPDRPGLEIWQVHERPSEYAAGDFRDAKTGELLWKLPSRGDAGRGMAANIDPRHKGYQCWSAPSDGLYSCKGVKVSNQKPRSCNFAIWWDGDLLRELLNRNYISKWNWQEGSETQLLNAEGCSANNSSKSTPALSADIFGDWREEVIWRTTDNQELRIYSTIIPTEHRLYTLMHDPQYRLAIAWQNVAYNQPPHPGFYLGEKMSPPPRPNIVLVKAKTSH
jgi:rhamnogalacturonan endolyase